jgi:adenylate cyclase 10
LKKVDNAELIDGAALSVKMGFGIGNVNILHLGGVFKRCEYLPVGDTLV